jgi:hypothetical protein
MTQYRPSDLSSSLKVRLWRLGRWHESHRSGVIWVEWRYWLVSEVRSDESQHPPTLSDQMRWQNSLLRQGPADVRGPPPLTGLLLHSYHIVYIPVKVPSSDG